ncbi:MAG: hypothetical protein Tsb0014_42280 [Pleurocapsa sp.]
MSNLKQLPKPNSDITDYEWEVTPTTVKIIIQNLQNSLKQKQKTLESLEVENQWLREQIGLQLDQSTNVYVHPLPEILLWTAVGLILTIGGTFVQAYSLAAPWSWFGQGIEVHTLGVSYQIGAVLLTACLGGKTAALLSQGAYLILGLMGLPIFDRGGGWEYIQQPSFGYLLGFIFGAWLCGWLAFQGLAKFSVIIVSCILGLLAIHLTGITYLTILYYVTGLGSEIQSLWQGISIYSLHPLPGQLAVICAVSLVAFLMRKLMFS